MAARGNCVLITTNPQGKFLSGVVSGTPKPGTVMEIVDAFYQNGQHQWQVYQPGTDGKRRLIAVLLEDDLQGFGLDDAYVTGTQCRLYVPIAGEELNMQFLNQSGTADDVAEAGLMMVDSGTGKLIPTSGSPESNPFISLVALTDPTADTVIPCMFTGY